VASLVDELGQGTNLTHIVVVLNNGNWLFKNCYLVEIMQLRGTKVSKLLVPKPVGLDLSIQWRSINVWGISHEVMLMDLDMRARIWSSSREGSFWMWRVHHRYEGKFTEALCNVLDYIDSASLWRFYYSLAMLITHLKTVLIKAPMQFHFAHSLSRKKIDPKSRHIEC